MFDKVKEFIRNIKFVWRYTNGDRFKIMMLLISNIVFIGIGIVFPLLSAKMIVSLTDNEFVRLLFIALIIFI